MASSIVPSPAALPQASERLLLLLESGNVLSHQAPFSDTFLHGACGQAPSPALSEQLLLRKPWKGGG